MDGHKITNLINSTLLVAQMFMGMHYLCIFISIGGWCTFLDLFTSPQPRFKLESDPMCGITTGGREECFWKCEVKSSKLPEGLFKGFLLTPPDCLLGCFTKEWALLLSIGNSSNMFIIMIIHKYFRIIASIISWWITRKTEFVNLRDLLIHWIIQQVHVKQS